MTRLPRRSFARPATEVAPELLGHVLARRLPDGAVLRARIVETEAYEQDDPASHAYRGRTPRVRASLPGPRLAVEVGRPGVFGPGLRRV